MEDGKAKTVWVVSIGNCEGSYVACICATKEIAELEILKQRDKLVKDWQSQMEWMDKQDRVFKDTMYQKMIENLKSDDYEIWNNYPHDCPSLFEIEVITAIRTAGERKGGMFCSCGKELIPYKRYEGAFMCPDHGPNGEREI